MSPVQETFMKCIYLVIINNIYQTLWILDANFHKISIALWCFQGKPKHGKTGERPWGYTL